MMRFFLIKSDPNNQLITHYILAQEYAFTNLYHFNVVTFAKS